MHSVLSLILLSEYERGTQLRTTMIVPLMTDMHLPLLFVSASARPPRLTQVGDIKQIGHSEISTTRRYN